MSTAGKTDRNVSSQAGATSRANTCFRNCPVYDFLFCGNLFGWAFGDDAAARVAAFGAEVDDPIGGLDDVEVVFDDEYGVAGVAEFVEHLQQLGDIGEMQAGCGLIQDIQCPPGGFLGQFRGQLHALGFAAAERRGLLADLEITQPDFLQRLENVANLRHGAEELLGLVHRHVENVGNIASLVSDFQRLAAVTFAAALFTSHVYVRQKMHFDLDDPVTLARLAASAFDIEAEPPRPVAAHLRIRQLGEQRADVIE